MKLKKRVICKCGCLQPREDLKYTSVGGKKAWRCKMHSRQKIGEIDYCEVVCKDCGEIRVTDLRNLNRIDRCVICQKKRSAEKNRIAMTKIHTKRKKLAKVKGAGNSIWDKEPEYVCGEIEITDLRNLNRIDRCKKKRSAEKNRIAMTKIQKLAKVKGAGNSIWDKESEYVCGKLEPDSRL